MLGQIVSGMYYIFENILSFLFSYSFCIFILIGFNLKLDDVKEFEKIININIIYYILIYAFSFIILLFSCMKRISQFEKIKDIFEKENYIFFIESKLYSFYIFLWKFFFLFLELNLKFILFLKENLIFGKNVISLF